MNMDVIARRIVKEYVEEHLDKSDKDIKESDKQPYIVWKCKTLQNWKYLMSTDLHDGMYYELTYNGDKKEWYFATYKKLRSVGYFRGIDFELKIDDVLAKCEVVG